MPGQRAAIWAWCLYDWACSAFNTLVTTFVFATYFVQAVAADPATATAQWAAGQAIAGFVVAVIAAPLGAIADRGGRRRAMLVLFTLLMALGTASLWFVRPRVEDALLAVALAAGATVAFEVATVFYNAMLPDVAPAERLGRISGLAWGLGYAGGLAALVLCLVLLIDRQPPPFGLDPSQAENVRAAPVMAAVWLLVFGWPVMLLVRDRTATLPWRLAAALGLAGLGATLRSAARSRPLLRFLIARMLYTDGLNTLFAFGAIYAAGRFAMTTHDVLLLGIGLNVSAGIGAFCFAMIEDRIGSKPVILAALGGLILCGCLVLLAQDRTQFWIASLPLGLFVGPAQSASRSLMARIAPPAERNALFGLYALSGRITGFVGPAALGAVTAALHSQRAGMLVIIFLLGGGAALLAGLPTSGRCPPGAPGPSPSQSRAAAATGSRKE